jgi:mannan endo-1,4-beta-mannosidase
MHREFARQLKKPLVFEEFGISRDANALTPHAPVSVRDKFYRAAFDQVIHSQESEMPVAGVNFWAWAGEAVPRHVEWQSGDPFIGDPPHEAQGWYSVFMSDATTLRTIADAARRLRAVTR